jgi:hypothetical protein
MEIDVKFVARLNTDSHPRMGKLCKGVKISDVTFAKAQGTSGQATSKTQASDGA